MWRRLSGVIPVLVAVGLPGARRWLIQTVRLNIWFYTTLVPAYLESGDPLYILIFLCLPRPVRRVVIWLLRLLVF